MEGDLSVCLLHCGDWTCGDIDILRILFVFTFVSSCESRPAGFCSGVWVL